MILRYSIFAALVTPIFLLSLNKGSSSAPIQADSRATDSFKANSSSQSAPKPTASPEATPLLSSLRQSFLPAGSKATRFKTQRTLDQLWAQDPPTDLILSESLDPSAPLGYRTHFANRLRKIGKTSTPSEKESLSTKIRDALNSPDHSTTAKSILTSPLIAFHDHPENLRTVVALIPDSPDDATSASLLSALSLSKSPLSRDALLRFTTAHAQDPDTHQAALRTALPPLARDPDSPIAPSLERIISRTSDPDFLHFATGQIFHQTPSTETLPLVSLAIQRSEQLASSETSQLMSLISSGLARWTNQRDTLSPEIMNLLDQIRTNLPR